MSSCSSSPRETPKPDFPTAAEDYFKATFEWSPSTATAVGFHEYDSRLEDRSAAAHQARIAKLKSQQSRFESMPVAQLSEDDRIDRDLILASIKGELLSLETLATWKDNPMGYVGGAGNAIDLLMKRSFAPPAERLKSVTARLNGVPALLQAMKANVQNPPKEFTDLSIRMAAGSIGFLTSDVTKWAKEAAGSDTAAFTAFQKANLAAIDAMKSATEWLKSDLLPRSKGKYAIGADNFLRKLEYDEGLSIPLDRLLEIGQANLEKDYRDFVETARKIDPKKKPGDVMAMLEKDHPTVADLLPSARRTLEGVRQFLIDKKICTVPSEVRPTIADTPPFARSGAFASMDTPGPFETKAAEAFYYITPPESDWDAKHTEEHLRLFNPYVMQMITIHEAYPGHYLQFLWAKQYPTKARKLISVSSNAEGWAHYTEQMMLDQGYGAGDPKIRLAQLSEALLRDCRFVNGIMLHTKGWSVEQGTKLFVEKGFQQPANAFEEARRGAYDPTYLYYTLGKLMIYKMRADYEKAKGPAFSLQQFHDEFVKQGSIPLPIIRQKLLPGDKPPMI